MSSVGRRAVIGLLALVMASSLTACSGSDTASSGAVRAATPAPSTASGTISGSEVSSTVRLALAQAGSVTISTAGDSVPKRMLVEYSPKNLAFRYTTPGRGFANAPDKVTELIDPLTLIGVGGSMYMATNPKRLPRPWLRVRVTATDEWGAFLSRNLSATIRNLNPYMVATMLDVADQVWVRPAEIGSAPGNQRFQAVIKGDNILKVMSDQDADRLRSVVSGLTQVCDITLDRQNRPLSLTVRVSGSTVTQSQAYSGWGPPVQIDAPAQSAVMDTPQLTAMGYSTADVQVQKT